MFLKKRAQTLIVGLVLLTIPFIAGCGGGETVEYTAADVAKTIDVAAGEQFKIVLDANESTGFIWRQAEGTDAKVVKLVTDEYIEANTGAVGADGKHHWTFEGVEPGETTIKLEYLRPWEPDASPEKTLNFKVAVPE